MTKIPTAVHFSKMFALAASFSKRVRANIYPACDTSGCGTRFPHYAEYAVTTVTNRRASAILKPPSDSKHTLYIPRSDRWADLRDWRQEGKFGLIDYTSPGTFLDPRSTVSFTAEIPVVVEKNWQRGFRIPTKNQRGTENGSREVAIFHDSSGAANKSRV